MSCWMVSKAFNKELSIIYDWISANKLSLNPNKSKYIIFHNHQRSRFLLDDLKIEIEGTSISRTNDIKFLGVIIDQNLKWNSQISSICQRIAKTIGTIRYLKHLLPKNNL